MRTITIILVGSVILSLALRASRPPKQKKVKPIDWNNTYYNQRFGLCKKLRIFNPVELVKAQAWSTDVFRKCGPSIVVDFATRYHFPVYGKFPSDCELNHISRRRALIYRGVLGPALGDPALTARSRTNHPFHECMNELRFAS